MEHNTILPFILLQLLIPPLKERQISEGKRQKLP
jgi:hypothetical protein